VTVLKLVLAGHSKPGESKTGKIGGVNPAKSGVQFRKPQISEWGIGADVFKKIYSSFRKPKSVPWGGGGEKVTSRRIPCDKNLVSANKES